MIRKDSGRSKFISLLVILTMVFSMIMPMGAWALPAEVTSIEVTTPPTKIVYTEGDELDLSELVVMLTRSDTTTSSVAFLDFASEGITTTPAQSGILTLSDTSVAITHTSSGQSTNQNITVNPVSPTLYTLTLNGTGLTTTPAAGSIAAGTSVTVTVAPPVGQMVNIFTVGGVDKKAELVNNQYTFNMPSENTTVVVSYIESNYIIDISEANVLLVGDYAFTLTNVDEAIYNLNNYIHAAQSVKNTGTKDAPQYHIYLHVGNGMWYDLVTNPDLDPTKKLSESEINAIQSKYGDPGKYVYINMEYVIDPS